MSNITEATDTNIQDLLNQNTLILMDFWAEWCAPCKQMIPVLEKVAESFGKELLVCKLNIDNNPQTATKHIIRSIPTLLLFKNNIVVSRKVGAMSQASIVEWISSSR
jgi:thioredoxin 1